MSEESSRNEMMKKTIVYAHPKMDSVAVRRDLPYREADGSPLTFDLYEPPGSNAGRRAAVIFVSGYSDPGGKLKAAGAYTSWGRLVAASGMAGIAYANVDPVGDLDVLVGHLRDHAPALGLDPERVALWACSGHAPVALDALARRASGAFACAALSYPYTLDLDGSSAVADAAAQFGFVAPRRQSLDRLAPTSPLLVVRAGADAMPRLNDTVDSFVAEALARNLPLTLVNLPAAPHAFDLFDDRDASREAIRAIVAFLRLHLAA